MFSLNAPKCNNLITAYNLQKHFPYIDFYVIGLKININHVVKSPCFKLYNNKVNSIVKSSISKLSFMNHIFKSHINSVSVLKKKTSCTPHYQFTP